MFFVPHPDDLEFGASLICIEALKKGFDVVEVLVTGGEYGTDKIEFRGKRLQRIRAYELSQTLKVYEKYTHNKLRLIKLGLIDGYSSLKKENIDKIVNLIKSEQPDLIFAPDPFYPVDFHRDHINTGRLPYIALRVLKKSEYPKRFYFYYSYKANTRLRCHFNNIKISYKAMLEHRSQVPPSRCKLYYGFQKLRLLISFLKTGRFSTKFRELKLKDDFSAQNRYFSCKDKIKNRFFMGWLSGLNNESQYLPLPEDLGLS
ncbi:MAG: PIG-L deacetylase family protein [Promethearchaeota archaeon]